MNDPQRIYSNDQSKYTDTGSDRRRIITPLMASAVPVTLLFISLTGAQVPTSSSDTGAFSRPHYESGTGMSPISNVTPRPTHNVSDPPDQRQRILQEVNQLKRNCEEDNWDGEGADRVTLKTVKTARSFIKQLPEEALDEDLYVGATPFGSIEFEWTPRDRVMLDIGILSSGEIGFAYWMQGEKGQGSEPWTKKIPESILDLIRKVCG